MQSENQLDENLPVELATDIRMFGHDADTVDDDDLRCAEDPVVLDAARVTGRVSFTLDKGIADLRRYPSSQHAGVVLVRPGNYGRGSVLAFVRQLLPVILELDLSNRLTVVGVSGIRLR